MENFREVFWGCTNLEGNVPELWKLGSNTEENNYEGYPDGEGCFYDCTSLSNYPIIPDYWKKDVK